MKIEANCSDQNEVFWFFVLLLVTQEIGKHCKFFICLLYFVGA
jgi:hypothetical protein